MSTTALSLLILATIPSAPPGVAGGDWIVVKPAVVTLLEEVETPAQEAGVLRELTVKPQDVVRQGETIATIDSTDANLEKQRAEAALDVAQKKVANDVKVRLAKKDLELATQEYERAKLTNQTVRRSVTAAELAKKLLEKEKAVLSVEDAENDLAVANEELRLAKADVLLAERKVQRFKIVAPLAGVVVKVRRRKGEWVEPGEAVLRLIRIDTLQVEGFLLNHQLKPGLTGAKVAFQPDNSEDVLPGKLIFVSPESNPADGRVRIAAEIDNRKRLLRAGMRGVLWIDGSPATAP